jgi:HAD superfamily hydrolase (TIGR01450 family)
VSQAERLVTVRLPTRLYEGYVLDLDGTVYLGDEALPGAVEGVRRLRELGRRVVFATNNPLHTADDYSAKLTRLGISASSGDIVTAVDSTLLYLEENHPGATLLVVGEPVVEEALQRCGFELTVEPARAEVVVVSFDRQFNYGKLNAAYRAVRLHGAVVVATNPDPYCPTPDGGLPDCAAMLAAVEACTTARAEVITGKPSSYMARALLSRLHTVAHNTLMVGDRLETDVAMALALEMPCALTLTGATGRDGVGEDGPEPDFVIESLMQLTSQVPASLLPNGGSAC